MYSTHELSNRGGGNRRTWLLAGGALAVVLVLLALIASACNARSSRLDAQLDPAGGAAATPSTTAGAPSGQPEDPADGASGVGSGSSGGATQGGGGNPGNGGGGNGNGGGNDGDDDGSDPEPEPMSIQATVFGAPATPTCHASGKITVTGGDAQVNVTYRWYRMDLPPHANPALPPAPLPVIMQEQTLPIPPASEITISSPDFPEDDAFNLVWLAVTIPQQVTSQQVKYGECGELGFGP